MFLIWSQTSILHILSGGNANKLERAEKNKRRRSYKRCTKRKGGKGLSQKRVVKDVLLIVNV